MPKWVCFNILNVYVYVNIAEIRHVFSSRCTVLQSLYLCVTSHFFALLKIVCTYYMFPKAFHSERCPSMTTVRTICLC